jgi:hypothetical protein
MNPMRMEVTGTVQPDGTLVLDEKLALPAGRIRLAIEVVTPSGRKDLWDTLEKIWAERKERGMRPRTAEEIDAELAEMRDEWEAHQEALERIQEDAQKTREQPPC